MYLLFSPRLCTIFISKSVSIYAHDRQKEGGVAQIIDRDGDRSITKEIQFHSDCSIDC